MNAWPAELREPLKSLFIFCFKVVMSTLNNSPFKVLDDGAWGSGDGDLAGVGRAS